MTRRKKRILIGVGIAAGISFVTLIIIAKMAASRFEPYIRDQAKAFLEKRFASEVEFAALRITMPHMSSLKLLFQKGAALARVEGEGIVLRHKGRRDIPPMFVMKSFAFEVNLGAVFDSPKRIQLVTIDGMEITVPPKGQRPDFGGGGDKDNQNDQDGGSSSTDVVIDQVLINDSVFTILPKDPGKPPLRFDLHNIRLESAGPNVAMKYDASLTNAKPPGEIHSTGTFGPWAAEEPGDSPLAGDYRFENADLGVFSGIAGILTSTGSFTGSLDTINAKGEATVPDFRLKRSGNPVPLQTTFEVGVDGTNGNTTLKPVVGTLGSTTFTTSGAVIKHETDTRRTIDLDVDMPKGDLRDVLNLAMKEGPLMEGQLYLKTKIRIPPLSGKVKEKLMLDGQFEITQGKFLKSTIQDQIDTLSRRGQGQPKNTEIDEVLLGMGGKFNLENEVITFSSLSFAVPGSGVDLAGSYDMGQDVLDFHGVLKLDAKVSQTMTGWKRWLLKPVDPFFSKGGAGTLLKIQVVGSAKKPQFGRDKGSDDDKDEKNSKDDKARENKSTENKNANAARNGKS